MYPFPDELTVSNTNKINSYLPVRNKNNDFCWETITGIVLSHALKAEVRDYDYEDFREDCKERFASKLDEPSFWEVLNRTYFSGMDIFSVSPMFLLFKAQRKSSGSKGWNAQDQRMAELFMSMMGNHFTQDRINEKLNFIEAEILSVLSEKLDKSESVDQKERPYLPFLAEAFVKDLKFLEGHPNYLLQELSNTLRLYAFSYVSQLALNVKNWSDGEPQSRPLYFILDTEKASSERVHVAKHGFKLLSNSSEALFPVLSALEVLQSKVIKQPLWYIYQQASEYQDKKRILDVLNNYIGTFIENRKLPPRQPAQNLEEAFKLFETVAIEQFKDEKTTRADINRKYVVECEKQIFGDFIQSRGRAGRVLVLNQDQLLLLTNLAIGERDKLRLHELLSEFEERGFYLDGQSQQQLVHFYERMGNVERMSDSGDAVYVRRTV
ncbi:DNA phosphorothioation-dependent restriction protein DptG [Gallaecimonas sp. GXIMD4217]|uniref:DNA phosphorothioation-dependent restriction protein DptG n=1 Tax=Gallaecimonas sp. GXIMD4217 TaxID=3131927 RepID=UPI00311B3672